ncbi:MAG: photosystem II protein Y [Cyanobacteria bacterium QH_8_48_120]|jgi:photosystem II PsbY protein|nr:MAG: photosystem II protein Y [Cyanobacteria bacterium QH_1_48_107]PSO54298.1 MAG: photosystem II protein Y [Cyanobacteria bacterium QH_10_48_56]PSO57254.1 MAG: photosystem II protein Y [Cyanobacteria bacterium QH_7_48_89]PSO61900.1 MAG: photosystem II protein Y [Cyanobacteria bacterium QH_2_48_84]PSO62108.1 MAG: photosystem II protein Y [Cyanobacteria bacterium QH_6_48_35]PSO71146.1 MAG: photosystem II protein Y [Cyanobacteria bacterium QH_8_48_120]PSO74113.1 MAG: photosystem II protein Y
MDWRLLIVLLPVIIAASWALFNIGSAAIEQARRFNDQG